MNYNVYDVCSMYFYDLYIERETYIFSCLLLYSCSCLKGLPGLKHFIVELKHIITPTKLLARPGVVRVTIYIHMLYSFMLTLECLHIYIYGLLVFYSCFTSLDICNCCNPPLLTFISLILLLSSYLTITFLGVCMLCVPAFWSSTVCGGK
jgi:hypothetical protein